MRSRTAVFAAMLAMAPLGAKAADLVVWWEKGLYPQEDEAVREVITAFEQETGKQVELKQPSSMILRLRRSPRFRPGSRRISCSAGTRTITTASGPTTTGSSTSRT